MNSIIVLVDFDNYVDIYSVPKNIPKQHHVNYAIDYLVDVVEKWSRKLKHRVDEFVFRFYGGWYESSDDNSKTELRIMIDSYCCAAKRIYNKTRLKFKVVESILADETKIFKKSVQRHEFSIRINKTILAQCSRKNLCVTKIVDDWQVNGCPWCKTSHKEILVNKTQKTVDSAIVCDMIYISKEKSCNYICLISADYDMIPGVIYSMSEGMRIALFRVALNNDYDSLIEGCSIENYIPPDFKIMGR